MSDESKSFTISSGEPTAAHSAVPMGIIVLTLVLLFGGFIYFDYTSGWFDPQVYGPYQSSEQVEAWQPMSGAAALLAKSKGVYEKNCGTCHGADGSGRPGQAPPLAGSEWVNAKTVNRLALIPLEGVNGQITVKGTSWNMSMAPMGAGLSDNDLAGVLSYIRTSWGNKGEAVNAEDITKIRAKIAGHAQPVSGEQLMKMPE